MGIKSIIKYGFVTLGLIFSLSSFAGGDAAVVLLVFSIVLIGLAHFIRLDVNQSPPSDAGLAPQQNLKQQIEPTRAETRLLAPG